MATDPTKSGRLRPPHPVRAERYETIALQDLVNFFSSYRRAPNPDGFAVAMERITALELLTSAEHRHGISGAMHAIMGLHPQLAKGWRVTYPKQMALMDACKPAEADSDVTRPPEIDYLWMYGMTRMDEYTIDRIIRIAMRTDAAGEAALMVSHHHMHHPLMVRALARAANSTTTAAHIDRTLPAQHIAALAHHASAHPLFSASVLYAGWRHPAKQPDGSTVPGAFEVRTADGQLPQGFPAIWNGHPVVASQATTAEVEKWHKLRALKERP